MNSDMGELPQEDEAKHIGWLWNLDGRKRSRAVQEWDCDFVLSGETQLAHEVCHSQSINATLNIALGATFKAFAGVCDIIKIFVVAAKSEPRLGVSVPRGCLKVAEGKARVVWDVFWVSTRCGKCSPKVEGLCHVHRWGIWGLDGRHLQDHRQRYLDEAMQLWVINHDGSDHRGIA